MLMSMAFIAGVGSKGRIYESMLTGTNGVRRSYVHATSRTHLQVKLREEDKAEGMCGELNITMYGAGDAAHLWESEYVEFVKEAGFERGHRCFLHIIPKRKLTQGSSAW